MGWFNFEWLKERYQKSVCRVRGHSWTCKWLMIKPATRGKEIIWTCSNCGMKVRDMFPADKYWCKDSLNELLRSKHGKYYKRLRKLAAAYEIARRAKLRSEKKSNGQ